MPSRPGAIAGFAGLAMLAVPASALPHMVMTRICSEGGVRMMAVPAPGEKPVRDECMKACHATCEGRKRAGKRPGV
ncbi:hypothetical protein [Sphingomonas colocasiae]|uniref:Uncharacterized protein n=1 Tax=Sphingomonas colocasiae TaxID=1848973 RepID=A0ABS7PMZ6_9SPHN|nr:hypothetical protein [Sphingomonas colocasiae]MBY8822090.1 hypothetical protein [Sphingomonas colocasiae]